MSEKAQKNMEAIMHEIAQLARLKIFEPAEIKKLVETRRIYEYKLAGPNKTLEDFKQYIDYEMKTLKMLQERRRRHKCAEKKTDIDYRMRKRIKNLFEMALLKYADDIYLCLSYFEFGRTRNVSSASDSAVLTLMKRHANKPQVWIISAKYYAYNKKDYVLALQTLEKGRAFHKDCGNIYREAIEIEIHKEFGMKSIMKREGEDLTGKKELCVKRILLYLEEMFTNVKDPEFYSSILRYFSTLDFTTEVETKIAEHVLKEFSNNAEIWHAVGQWEFNRYLPEGQESSAKARLTSAGSKYYQGVDTIVDASEKKALWKLFLDFLIDLIQDNLSTAKQHKKNYFKQACEKANQDGCMEENHYLKWMELVEQADKGSILEHATEHSPQSVELWKLRLQYLFMSLQKNDLIEQCFRIAVSHLKDSALPIWMSFIRYKCLHSPEFDVENIYKEAITQTAKISMYMKPQYLEWVALNKDLEKAREVYLEMVKEEPYCRKLHITMSKLEACDINPNFKEWEQVHKLACEQFGEEDEDVWISCIEFYKNYQRKDKDPNSLQIMQEVYNKATNTLPQYLKIDFKQKLDQLNIKFDQ